MKKRERKISKSKKPPLLSSLKDVQKMLKAQLPLKKSWKNHLSRHFLALFLSEDNLADREMLFSSSSLFEEG